MILTNGTKRIYKCLQTTYLAKNFLLYLLPQNQDHLLPHLRPRPQNL